MNGFYYVSKKTLLKEDSVIVVEVGNNIGVNFYIYAFEFIYLKNNENNLMIFWKNEKREWNVTNRGDKILYIKNINGILMEEYIKRNFSMYITVKLIEEKINREKIENIIGKDLYNEWIIGEII